MLVDRNLRLGRELEAAAAGLEIDRGRMDTRCVPLAADARHSWQFLI
jgi:hypothetical protein